MPNDPNAVHVRIVYPANEPKGVRKVSRRAKFYITLPGQPEVHVPSLREAKLSMGLDDADQIQLTMLGTMEIVYEDEA